MITKQQIETELDKIYEETKNLNWNLKALNIDSSEELHKIRNSVTTIKMQLKRDNNGP